VEASKGGGKNYQKGDGLHRALPEGKRGETKTEKRNGKTGENPKKGI